jgi:hypothetical protein
MQNDVSPAPRLAISPVALLFGGVPKGTVVLLLAVAAWWVVARGIAGLEWAASWGLAHWPL